MRHGPGHELSRALSRVEPNAVDLLFRHRFQEYLAGLLAPGSRVLDLEGGDEARAFLRIRGFEVRGTDAMATATQVPFDGAYGDLGRFAATKVSEALAAALRPGAPVLFSAPGGREGREAARRLAAVFDWRRVEAFGVFLPRPERAGWTSGRPQTFGLLAALDRALRAWPIVRWTGDRVLLEGRRR